MFDAEIVSMLHLIHCENGIIIRNQLSEFMDKEKVNSICQQFDDEMTRINKSIEERYGIGCNNCIYKENHNRIKEIMNEKRNKEELEKENK